MTWCDVIGSYSMIISSLNIKGLYINVEL